MNPEAARQIDRVIHGSTDEPGFLDLSQNTNPLRPPGIEAVYQEAFETARSYPPEPPTVYQAAASEYVGCEPEQVIPTPGGLAALRLAMSLVISAGDSVLLPRPSFGEYAREVHLHGGEPAFVDDDSILTEDPGAYSLVVICNPNNPTGTGYDEAALRDFAARCRAEATTLLVDEAFLGFTTDRSLAGEDGVIVARSLTKLFGLPGIRMGFAVATGEQRERLAGARRPWNMSVPALAVGAYGMQQAGFIEQTRERVAQERSRLIEALEGEVDVSPSNAPFVLLDVKDQRVPELLERARRHGIILRDARSFPGLDNHLRIAVGLPQHTDRIIEVLSDA